MYISITKKHKKFSPSEKELDRCNKALYGDSSTVRGKPMLGPAELIQAISQFEDILHKLDSSLERMKEDFDSKKKVSYWMLWVF